MEELDVLHLLYGHLLVQYTPESIIFNKEWCCNHGAGSRSKERHHAPPLHHQAIETMNSKELEFPRVSCWETGKAGALTTVRELVS